MVEVGEVGLEGQEEGEVCQAHLGPPLVVEVERGQQHLEAWL